MRQPWGERPADGARGGVRLRESRYLGRTGPISPAAPGYGLPASRPARPPDDCSTARVWADPGLSTHYRFLTHRALHQALVREDATHETLSTPSVALGVRDLGRYALDLECFLGEKRSARFGASGTDLAYVSARNTLYRSGSGGNHQLSSRWCRAQRADQRARSLLGQALARDIRGSHRRRSLRLQAALGDCLARADVGAGH